MKKIITLLIALVLSANTVFAADIIKKDYDGKEDAYMPVFELGIINEDDASEFEDVVLTRGQFVKIAYNVKNYQNKDTVPTAETSYFEDVDIYHYAAGYIQYLVGSGVVKGYETGEFRPEQDITVDEAARMLLRCGGYGVYEDYGFGDLSSYIAEVKKGVSGGVTYKNAAKMIYNLLFMNSMKLTTIGANFGYESSDIILEDVLKLDYIDGTVEAIDGRSLYTDEVSDGEIIVGGNSFEISEEAIDKELLGMYARVILNDGTAVAALPLKNTVMKINAEDVDDFKDGKLYYYDNEKDKSLKLADDMDILYNGYAVGGLSDKLPKYGSVTAIDRQSNGTCDVVMVEEYQSYLVKTVGINTETITLKTNNGDKVVNLKDYEKTEIVNEDGFEMQLSLISENNVLMVYSYEKEYFKAVVVSNKADITIKGMGTNSDGDKVIKSADNEYVVYEDYYYVTEPALSENVTLYLDATGKAVGVLSNGNASWKMGYLIFVRMADTDEGEKRILIKLVNDEGVVEKLYCDEKVYVNGSKLTTDEAFTTINNAYNNFADKLVIDGKESENYTTRLVRYYRSGDVIKRVDTPLIRGMYSESKVVTSSNDQLLLHAKGELYNPENATGFKVVWSTDLKGDILFDTDAIIFIIPEDTNSNPEDDDYGVMKASAFKYSSGKFYYTSGYTCSADGLKSNVAVVRKNKGSSSSSSALLINNVNRVVGGDDEIVYQIESLDGNKYLVNEKSSNVAPSQVQKGDIILYEVSNGEMIINKVLYRADGSGDLNKNKYYSSDGSTYHFNAEFRVMLGTAGKRDGSYMQLSYNGERLDELITLPKSISVYDMSGDKVKLYMGDRNDITYGDEIMITSRKGVLGSVFLIKK